VKGVAKKSRDTFEVLEEGHHTPCFVLKPVRWGVPGSNPVSVSGRIERARS
jgi:hypothetical protein